MLIFIIFVALTIRTVENYNDNAPKTDESRLYGMDCKPFVVGANFCIMVIKKCEWCEKTFVAETGNIRRCNSCIKLKTIAYYNRDKMFFGFIECAICGTSFQKRNKTNIYCGDKCRNESVSKKYYDSKEISYYTIFKRDNFTCIYCGKSSIEDGIKLAVDHVYPRKYGCKNELLNLVTACVDCNSHKNGNLLPKDTLLRILKRNTELNKSYEGTYNELIADFNRIWGLQELPREPLTSQKS